MRSGWSLDESGIQTLDETRRTSMVFKLWSSNYETDDGRHRHQEARRCGSDRRHFAADKLHTESERLIEAANVMAVYLAKIKKQQTTTRCPAARVRLPFFFLNSFALKCSSLRVLLCVSPVEPTALLPSSMLSSIDLSNGDSLIWDSIDWTLCVVNSILLTISYHTELPCQFFQFILLF